MKSFVRLRKSAKHVDSSFNSIILETMNKELHEHRCRLFTIYVLRLLEREKEWNAEQRRIGKTEFARAVVDEIANAAFDLSLASTDEHGNFIANNFEKAVDAE